MSLDHTAEQMRSFGHMLNRFNEGLNSSVADLHRCHEHVDPLWQDEFRRNYDGLWRDFHEAMDNYLRKERPAYEEFIAQKLRAIESYLHGS